MTNLIGRKVSTIRMHQGIHIPGVGQLDNVLPSQTKTGDWYMERTDGGVYVNFTYRPAGRMGTSVEFEITDAQCMFIAYFPEDKPPAIKAVA